MNWYWEYKKSLKMVEVEEVIDLILYRPLAFLLVISVYNTKIKPDHLTLTAMLMGIIGGYFYSIGSHQSAIIGAICYLLFNIFDCSDGQLARLKKNGSSVGRLLDGIADYIAAIAVYAGIVIGYSNSPEQSSHMTILIALAGISIIVQESLVDYFRMRFLDIVLQRQLIAKRKRKKFISSTPEKYFKANRIIIRFWVFMGPSAKITILILCSFFCRFDIFFWIVIGGFNILAVLLWLIQYRIDKTFETQKI